MGCCCANANATNAANINRIGIGLDMVNNSCVQKAPDYSFKLKNDNDPAADTCVKVCSGFITPPVTNPTYKVSGIIYNTTTSKPFAGVNVYIPIPQGTISNVTDSNGAFTLYNVSIMSTFVYGTYSPYCYAAQSAPIIVGKDNKDTTGVYITLNCNKAGCINAPLTITKPIPIEKTNNITFNIEYVDKCLDFKQYEISRCDGEFKNCNSLPVQFDTTVIDSGLENNTKYCYVVNVRTNTGVVAG